MADLIASAAECVEKEDRAVQRCTEEELPFLKGIEVPLAQGHRHRHEGMTRAGAGGRGDQQCAVLGQAPRICQNPSPERCSPVQGPGLGRGSPGRRRRLRRRRWASGAEDHHGGAGKP